jgi:hypothetical protein
MPGASAKPTKDPRTICGWCGKSEADGVKLVAGPITCICAQCCRLVAVLHQILPPEGKKDGPPDLKK